jgi:hypothetical protein
MHCRWCPGGVAPSRHPWHLYRRETRRLIGHSRRFWHRVSELLSPLQSGLANISFTIKPNDNHGNWQIDARSAGHYGASAAQSSVRL